MGEGEGSFLDNVIRGMAKEGNIEPRGRLSARTIMKARGQREGKQSRVESLARAKPRSLVKY